MQWPLACQNAQRAVQGRVLLLHHAATANRHIGTPAAARAPVAPATASPSTAPAPLLLCRPRTAPVPRRYHGYFYYTRQETGKQYAIHCRRKVPAHMEAAGPTEADVVDESVPEEVGRGWGLGMLGFGVRECF